MKINDDEWSFEKVVLFSRWKISGGNAYFIYEFSPRITSSRLSPPAWRYICATILTFGDESMSERILGQRGHVFPSMDLSMEVSKSFG